jgi:[ribosomal protein S5]-alanine N-acetyltransferase
MFQTARLLVRQFVTSDLDAFAELCADPRVMKYVDDGTTLPRSEVERWIDVCQDKYAARGYGTSAVFEKSSKRFIGYCGVVRAPGNDFDELIYVFHVDAWGKGYATEAARAMLEYVFKHSSLAQIYATVAPENQHSVHVAQKLGFRFEKEELEEDGLPTAYYVLERPIR